MRNIDIDINAPVEDDYEDVFGLSECDENDSIEEVLVVDKATEKRVRRAREGVNSVRLSSNDSDILEFMKDKGSFSKYVKKLIRAEIERSHNTDLDTELKELNNKINQVLHILQNSQDLKIQPTTNNDSSNFVEGEVFDNPNAHQFSPKALEGVMGILNRSYK